uniref:Apple domain-containing protein n=1 Tax=Romanomermis culicivorax TaxID=13658 RepID=A0A915L560_ROMCU
MDIKPIILLICMRVYSASNCEPIFVRWSRVRLNLSAKLSKAENLSDCSLTCASDVNCLGFNHKQGANYLSNDCQIFYDDQKFNVDDHVEADDRFSYYWKYCTDKQHYSEAGHEIDDFIHTRLWKSEMSEEGLSGQLCFAVRCRRAPYGTQV